MIKLLVIDDDLATSDFLRSFFTQRGYRVFVANDRDMALSIVKEEGPNIILLDIRIPGSSGIEILQDIKQINRDSKVIMMSAVDEEVVVKLAIKYGAVNYITKPFSLDQLEQEVFVRCNKNPAYLEDANS